MGHHVQLKQRTARLSVISNTVLVGLKLVVGFYTGSVSIISEAAHSAVDLIAALVAFYAVRKSDKPPDAQHAYGHGKIENLSGAIEAVLIILAAVWIVYEAIQKLYTPHPVEYIEYGLAIMMVSVIINFFVSRKLFEVAKKTGSHALEADALHLQADIWSSLGVLVGLGIIQATGLYWMDPLIAIIVAGVVFKAGYSMTQKSMYELTDISLPEEEEEIIKDIVKKHPNVIDFQRLRTRRSGSRRHIDMNLIMPSNISLGEAHLTCDEIEKEIEDYLGSCDVVIHPEPGFEDVKNPLS